MLFHQLLLPHEHMVAIADTTVTNPQIVVTSPPATHAAATNVLHHPDEMNKLSPLFFIV